MKTMIRAAAAALAIGLAAPVAAQDSSYLEDRIMIEDLMSRYIFALDWRDAEMYAETFTEDGVLNYGGGQAVGRDAIAALVQGIRDNETESAASDATGLRPPHTQHFVTNIVLDIDGDEATSWAYWVAMSNNTEDRAARVSSYGHYVDHLRKVDGEWLFTDRRTFNEQIEGREGPDLSPIMTIN